jgi:peroxiredoxin
MFSFKSVAAVVAGISLVGVCGCGEAPKTESRPPKRIADAPADPLPQVAQNGEAKRNAAPPVAARPVVQAANEEVVKSAEPATVPPVLLTKQHEALCRVKVGEAMPAIELAKVDGDKTKLADLYGKAATVVVFWKGDRRMAREELADLGPDVVDALGKKGVSVVGIAQQESSDAARKTLEETSAKFPNLVDADGKAFAKIGAQKLPWTLVLDSNGKIVWFDLEYSHATRRELQQALLATIK